MGSTELDSRECFGCKKIYVPKQPHQKYCSRTCWSNLIKSSYVKQFKKEHRNCGICGQLYLAKQPNQKYCSRICTNRSAAMSAQKSYVSTSNFSPEERRCKICNEAYTANRPNQKYCSRTCMLKSIQHTKTFKPTRENCKRCCKEYLTKQPNQIYCSSECRRFDSPKAKNESITYKAAYPNFSDLLCLNEEEFVHWFKHNFSLFGIKEIIKLDRFFPDCVARTYDNLVRRIELEHYSSNFVSHDHDPSGCDIIISYAKPWDQRSIKCVPVLSVFNMTKGKYQGRMLTDYFINIVKYCEQSMNTYIIENSVGTSPAYRFENKGQQCTQKNIKTELASETLT